MTNLKVLFDKIKQLSQYIDPNIKFVVYGDVYELKMEKLSKEEFDRCSNFYGN